MCGDPSDEMDHRLAIEVARVLGPAAMARSCQTTYVALQQLPQAQNQTALAAGATRQMASVVSATEQVLGRSSAESNLRMQILIFSSLLSELVDIQ